jgi:membrane protease YdiL (CAAX protease family)
MQFHDELDNRKAQLLEVLVFLFLIVPSMVLSLFVIRLGGLGFVFTAISAILRDLALVSLILYFLWRNCETLDQLGWNFRNGWKDVFLGVVLFIPMFFGAGLLDQFLQAAGLSAPATAMPSFLEARGRFELLLAAFLVIVVAIAEETIFRGYLLLRFRGINLSLPSAAGWSAVIFCSLWSTSGGRAWSPPWSCISCRTLSGLCWRPCWDSNKTYRLPLRQTLSASGLTHYQLRGSPMRKMEQYV